MKRNHVRMKKIGKALLCALLLLSTVASLFSCGISDKIESLYLDMFGPKASVLTVSVNKMDQMKFALALSETPEFTSYTSRLNTGIFEEITNIQESDLPEGLENVNGEHNGENYVAYTFYCKNMGEKTVTYSYEMYITHDTKNIAKALRFRLYVDDILYDDDPIHYDVYAYPRTDGVEGPEPGTVKFQSDTTVVKDEIEHFGPGDITKYTVVIWLEGPDPDCVENILGGEFKVDMLMSVLKNETDDEVVSSPGIRS